MTDYGGFGGVKGGREIDTDDKFEMLLNTLFGERIKADREFCEQLWASLANVDWKNEKSGDTAVYSFRAAGDLIAAIRGEGDYMDWYRSGPFATVSGEIEEALEAEGWTWDSEEE